MAIVWAGALCMTLTQCAKDPTPADPLSNNPYLTLRLNTRAAIMSTVAPYDTLQLIATPYDASGAVLSTRGTVTYSTTDTAVTVSASGLVHALTTSPGAYIVAKLQDPASNITHMDTAFIVVTDQAPSSPLATFAIQPLPGDSTRLGVTNISFPLDTIVVGATDGHGNDITPNLLIQYTSSDSNVASVSPLGVVTGNRLGTVTIVATTTYYGIAKRDSVRLTITDPVLGHVMLLRQNKLASDGTPVFGFGPASLTIGAGGTVVFGFNLVSPTLGVLDVVFDDPSAVQPSPLSMTVTNASTEAGNIAPIPQPSLDSLFAKCIDVMHFEYGFYLCQAARAFPTPGTYHYHSARYGTEGTIIVRGH